jgi:hypothetical protein
LHQRFDRRFYFSTVSSSDATMKRGSYLSYSLAVTRFFLTLILAAAAPALVRRRPLCLRRFNSRACARAPRRPSAVLPHSPPAATPLLPRPIPSVCRLPQQPTVAPLPCSSAVRRCWELAGDSKESARPNSASTAAPRRFFLLAVVSTSKSPLFPPP